MAYISRECMECTDKTKKFAGGYSGKDENGKRFHGRMYSCDNAACEINRARLRIRKAMRRSGQAG